MKYDITKPLTNGSRRTLDTFSKTMFTILSEMSFEQTSVGYLCEKALYPRATFYNYFDDKYDLLNYCWKTLAQQIGLQEYHHAEENEMLYLYFDRIYDFTNKNIKIIHEVLKYNNETGYMFLSFRNFLNDNMRFIFKNCPEASQKEIPNDLLADHYSNTFFLVWQWATIKNNNCSKQQAHKYLSYLLNNL